MSGGMEIHKNYHPSNFLGLFVTLSLFRWFLGKNLLSPFNILKIHEIHQCDGLKFIFDESKFYNTGRYDEICSIIISFISVLNAGRKSPKANYFSFDHSLLP